MYPQIILFGQRVGTYRVCFYVALLTIPVLFFLLRKHFGFTVKRTLFYVVFTLGFGLLSARITAIIKDWLLTLDSNGAYTSGELLRIYGIPMFLPIFFLIYCLLFKDRFRTVMDYLAPGVYSVMTFVKLGCAFCGCCYGFPDEDGIMNVNLGYRTFPVQLYDMLCSACISIICIVLIYTLRKKHEGFIYPIGGILFALTKGYWEYFRVHTSKWERNFFDTGFTFWQFWMMVLFVGCLIWLIMAIIWEKKEIADFDKMPYPGIQLTKLFQERKKKAVHNKKSKEKKK